MDEKKPPNIDQPPVQELSTDEDEKARKKKKQVMSWIVIGFSLIALFIFAWWFFLARFVASTKDAYVHGNQVRLTPQIPGIVTAVNVNETELVSEGQVLVRLDQTDRRLAFEKAKTELAESVRRVTKMFENVYALAARFEIRQAELFRAEVNYLDRKNVVSEGAVSDEEFIHSEAQYHAAKAAVQETKYRLMQAISEVQNTTVPTHPLVERAKEGVRRTWVDLQRCTLKAPASGIIAQRSVQVGQSVMPHDALLAIIPLDQMWINANFKETHLSKIRIGQSVSMRADTYGHAVSFSGQVIGIGSGSGAVFSALPPQNATGNWIKIVQRIPVRISLNTEQLRRYPLRLGLSMHVDVDVRDKEGRRVPLQSAEKPLYTTTVFQDQEKGASPVIEEIIKANQTHEMTIGYDVLSLVGRS